MTDLSVSFFIYDDINLVGLINVAKQQVQNVHLLFQTIQI